MMGQAYRREGQDICGFPILFDKERNVIWKAPSEGLHRVFSQDCTGELVDRFECLLHWGKYERSHGYPPQPPAATFTWLYRTCAEHLAQLHASVKMRFR
jgi:hypothetical protein